MNTGMKKNITWGILCVLLSACSQPTIEEEAKSYCDCLQGLKNQTTQREDCREIMKSLLEKYEFSPDESEKLNETLMDCKIED